MITIPNRGDNNHTLRVLNFWLALCNADRGLPRFMMEAGYEVLVVEQTYKLGSGRIIKPDVVLGSRAQQHVVLVETKSGANTKPDQLAAYGSASLEDAADSIARYTVTVCECAVFGKAEHADRLKIGLVAPVAFPLLSVHKDSVQLDHSGFQNARLNTQFKYLSIRWDSLQSRVLANSESEDYELAELVSSLIMQGLLFADEQREMPLIDFCKELWSEEYWNKFGGDEKKELARRVHFLLHAAKELLPEMLSYQAQVVIYRSGHRKKKKFFERQREKAHEYCNYVTQPDWPKLLAKRIEKNKKAAQTRLATQQKKEEEAAAAALEVTGQFKMFPGLAPDPPSASAGSVAGYPD